MTLVTVSAYETLMGYSFLTKVFAALEDLHLPVDAVNTTEASVTLAIADSPKLDQLTKNLIAFGSVEIESEKGLISLIGCKIAEMKKLNEQIFSSIGETTVDMITFTKDKRILSLVVNENDLIPTAQGIHDQVF